MQASILRVRGLRAAAVQAPQSARPLCARQCPRLVRKQPHCAVSAAGSKLVEVQAVQAVPAGEAQASQAAPAAAAVLAQFGGAGTLTGLAGLCLIGCAWWIQAAQARRYQQAYAYYRGLPAPARESEKEAYVLQRALWACTASRVILWAACVMNAERVATLLAHAFPAASFLNPIIEKLGLTTLVAGTVAGVLAPCFLDTLKKRDEFLSTLNL